MFLAIVFALGAFVGWQLTFLTLMMASVAGSVIGIGLIVTKRGGMKYALPFGTFLAMGAAAAATVGVHASAAESPKVRMPNQSSAPE